MTPPPELVDLSECEVQVIGVVELVPLVAAPPPLPIVAVPPIRTSRSGFG